MMFAKIFSSDGNHRRVVVVVVVVVVVGRECRKWDSKLQFNEVNHK